MANLNTQIEWCDATWSPVTGCTKVSPGCAHCYAERLFPRPYPGRPFSDVRFHRERLDQPRAWRKPRRVFVNSMSDLFHEAVSVDQIADIYAVMRDTPRHTYQILTKRPARMRETMRHPLIGDVASYPLPNVWLGVSVENQATADERIPLLLDTPAAVRFLSVEPLLGPVNIAEWLTAQTSGSSFEDGHGVERDDITWRPLAGIDWCIVGGESGPKARPCELRWIGSVVDQCAVAGVPAFVKQLGAHPMHTSLIDGRHGPLQIQDRKGGDPSEWPPELQVREFPR